MDIFALRKTWNSERSSFRERKRERNGRWRIVFDEGMGQDQERR